MLTILTQKKCFSESLFEEAFHVYYNTSFMVLNDEKHTENTAVTRFDRATIPEKIDPQFWLYIFLAIFFAIILLSAIIYLLYKVSSKLR